MYVDASNVEHVITFVTQRIPENRKLPCHASVYYFTYGQAEEG